MTHVATKLRNRLLCELIKLTMGSKTVSIEHLKKLIKDVNKSIHGLSAYDICPLDRQNFRSYQKIIDKRVIEALKQYVKNSEGMVKYLQLCSDITYSFLDFELSPLDRLFRMFRSVFFLRIWHKWIKSSPSYTVKHNFISHNAYACIELNAKSMLELMKQFRDESMPQMFLLTMFDSQTCEKAFRQFRAMGTTNFIRINFSLYDLLHMVGKIEVQNEISYFKLADGNVLFPLSHKKSKKTQIHELPTDIDINSTIERAKKAAIQDAQFLKMTAENIDTHEFRSHLFATSNNDEVEAILEDDEELDPRLDHFEDDFEAMFNGNEEETREEAIDQNKEEMNSDSRFTVVVDENGKGPKTIRKSTLVWILTEPGATVSKDRLKRVQVSKKRRMEVED